MITQWFKKLSLKQLQLPKICVLCGQYHIDRDAICIACHEFLTPIPSACMPCALPLPPGNFMTCGECIKNKPYVDHTIAPYAFEEPLRTLLHDYKYKHGLYLISFLAQLIIKNLPPEALHTECMIPIPMHPNRLRQRGFNQAAELTKVIGEYLNIPYHLSSCQKTIQTKPQAGLNAEQRHRNLLNVFSTESISYQHVTLIDDLLTTGSTVNELAKTFKKNGVAHVNVWCCARVLEPILHALV